MKRGILIGLLFAIVFAVVTIVSPQDSFELISPVKKINLLGSNTTEFIPETKIFLTGDVMLGRTVMTTSMDKENNPTYPFENVWERMNGADIAFVNLENPIVEGCPRHYDGFKFCADPVMVEGLNFAGVDVVTLANNHSGNYGKSGLDQTFRYLDNSDISYTHDGSLVEFSVNNLQFGFVGFNHVGFAPKEGDYEKISEYDKKVDVLIVSPHWGVEYRSEPSAIQREWAKRFVKEGADVIVGHHPHWVQSVEYFDGDGEALNDFTFGSGEKIVPVYYSLGNFIFDQMWSEETKKGLAVELTFDEEGRVVMEERLPIYMSDWSQPEFVE